jgi:hypothetical protein
MDKVRNHYTVRDAPSIKLSIGSAVEFNIFFLKERQIVDS